MHFFDASPGLNLKNKEYLRCARRYILEAFREDAGASDDPTTRSFVDQPRRIVLGRVVAKETGILAGVPEATWFLAELGIRAHCTLKDGATLKKGAEVMRLEGEAQKILTAERTLLNLLQRMSGVATAAKRLSLKIPFSVQLLTTRKTLWGLLDKRAAYIGGAWTHRLNLGDAILIKDNHLRLASDLEESLVRVFDKNRKARFIEIEAESADLAKQIQELYERHCRRCALTDRFAVLLDNFSVEEARKIAPLLRRSGIVVEVSGGIDERNIRKYAVPGVSAISCGSITNKAAALDMSMEILT